MSDENSFGSMLKWARMRTQWKQQQVADKLEVSRVTVNRWENDLQLPSAYYLKQLVAILDLNEKDADALYRAAAQVPPIIDNLPFHRNPFFTGREEHLDQLRKQLQETGTASITQSISISGLGGIGKTELALEYAHRHYPNVYRVALWVDAADTATLQRSYYAIAERLELPARNEQELDRRIQAVKDWLQTHTNWLLIMDSADDLLLASSFLPSKPLGHVVFTTQSQIIGTIPRQIEIEAMEPTDDGLLLLLRRSHPLKVEATLDEFDADIREAALQVAELLGGHPLALDQAGAYIEETRVSFTDYLKRYRAERHRLLSRRGSFGSRYREHPDPIAVSFNLSFEKACERDPLATDILNFCAFLQPDTIPEELFQHDESFKYGTTVFDEGIAALQQYSLIKCDIQAVCLIDGLTYDSNLQQYSHIKRNIQAKTFSMHRLVQAVLIDAMSPDLRQQWKARIIRDLNAAFPEHYFTLRDDRVPNGFLIAREYNRLLPHVLVCASWPEPDLVPVLEASELLHKLGFWLLKEPRYIEAEPILSQTLALQERCLGVEHLDIAVTLHELAITYYHRSDFDELAEPLYRRAFAIREKQLGVDHSLTHVSRNALAMIQMDRDRVDAPPRLIELSIIEGMPYLEGATIYTQEIRERLAEVVRVQKFDETMLKILRDERDAKAAALEVTDEPSV